MSVTDALQLLLQGAAAMSSHLQQVHTGCSFMYETGPVHKEPGLGSQ